jgi:hypothetical protein
MLLICIGVVLFSVVVMLYLFAILYSFSPFVCFILMVDFYNIFADYKKRVSGLIVPDTDFFF